MEQHLTVEDFARREQVPVATVYTWNSLGIAPPRIKIGRHVRYRLADVIEWERRHTRDGAA